MIKIDGLEQVIAQIQTERGISADEIKEAIKEALIATGKRYHGTDENLRAELNSLTNSAAIFVTKKIVKIVENPLFEITLKDAKKTNNKAKIHEEIDIEIIPPDFGRIAAQKAKQVITQKILEAEKRSINAEYEDKIGELITGVVQRIEGRNYLVNIGRTESILDFRNQIPGEEYRIKDRIKLYLVDIARTNRGPEVIISRSHEGFIRKMFELEVPDIQDGVIEIKSISRRAGYRTKIAVYSNDPQVGAVGTCVGRMGSRIQSILKEINGEKVDIIEWFEDPSNFIANSLKPANVYRVDIEDEEERKARVIVEEDQLSLAIGRSGLNVRLASKLTNWHIDVVNKKDIEINLMDKLMADKIKNKQEPEEKIEEEEKTKKIDETKKIKVNEAARELGMDTNIFIKKLDEMNIKVKSATSNIDYDVYMEVKESMI